MDFFSAPFPCEFQRLNHDILSDIFRRLDGSSAAAAACACSDFRDVSQDQSLWQQLCHSTWPSTAMEEARHVMASSPLGGFDRFYADSYPLVLSNNIAGGGDRAGPPGGLSTSGCPSDFVSLIDIYYQNKCIFSRVVDGIPGAMATAMAMGVHNDLAESAGDHQMWFSSCPFKLDALIFQPPESPSLSNVEDGKWGRADFCRELKEDLRLSWVLLDKKKGKAINLSSWKPLLVQRSWHSSMDYMLRFGSIVAMDDEHSAECAILVRCMLTGRGEPVLWREISMTIHDMAGAPLSGGKSLMVLNRALYCLRTVNHLQVEEGYHQYEREKKEIKRRKEHREALADKLCISIELAVFVIFGYACTIFF